MSAWIPPLIHWQRDALNGHYPAAGFYSRAIAAENFLVGHGDREVVQKSWRLGYTPSPGYSGTTTHRFRFRSRYGAAFLRTTLTVLMMPVSNTTPVPYIEVVVTQVGVGSTTRTFTGAIDTGGLGNDRPSDWRIAIDTMALTPNAAYTVEVKLYDYARIGSVVMHEVGNATISQATDYYNSLIAQAGTEITEATRSRLLIGLSAMYCANAGTVSHWGKADGTAQARTSATFANLIDGSTTGAPTAATPGPHLDLSYRATHSRPTSVPIEIACFASIPSGSGSVRLVDASANVIATITVNSSTPAWFVATGLAPTTPQKFDWQFAGSGTQSIGVSSASLIEWESR